MLKVYGITSMYFWMVHCTFKAYLQPTFVLNIPSKKNITMASHTTCCYNTPTAVYIIEFITYNNVFKTFLLLRAAVVVCIFGCIQTQQLFYWLRSIASIKPLNTWIQFVYNDADSLVKMYEVLYMKLLSCCELCKYRFFMGKLSICNTYLNCTDLNEISRAFVIHNNRNHILFLIRFKYGETRSGVHFSQKIPLF